MTQPSPLLTYSNTILWLKVALTAALLWVLYLRYRKIAAAEDATRTYSLPVKAAVAAAVLFSFAVFHDLGALRGGSFVNYSEMFHYYVGAKYFKETGYYHLYDAVIVADAEQNQALAALPFYTNLRTYQNAQRQAALQNATRIRALFSKERWSAFKDDIAYFKSATGMPQAPGLRGILTDHGYNGSPVTTFVLGMLANAVPITQMPLLASFDVIGVAAMMLLVFHTFGLELAGFFSSYFFVNFLNGHETISGSILRYDWLLYIVSAVCLLERGRYAASAFFLTMSAMIRVFPGLLFYGMAVVIIRKVSTTRKLDSKHQRFIVAAGVTALVLFLLPATTLGSTLQPWKEFYTNASLHSSGVHVNHIGLRGIILFEPSHLSLERFVETFSTPYTNDIVLHWENVKANELHNRQPVLVLVTLLVLACLTLVIWKRGENESESLLWPLILVYTAGYLSHYYYAFLCLFVLLFFRSAHSPSGFVPLCLLLMFNIASLVSDYFGMSPIVLYTATNIYLFICLSSILCFELYTVLVRTRPVVERASSVRPRKPRRVSAKKR